MKKLKNLLITGLSSILIISTSTTALASVSVNTKQNNYNIEEKTIPITIYSDENKTVIADVPISKVNEYKKDLKNKEFLNNEIKKGTSSKNESILLKSTITKYMKSTEILKVLKSIDNSFNWDYYLSNPVTDGVIARAVAKLTKYNFITTAIGVLTWMAADLQARQREWWNESALLILQKKIKGVKLEIKENTTSDYPKIYRTLTRY